jgi:short-subunit dehydrogenase
LCESNHWLKHTSEKLVQYDRIDLIVPARRKELIVDLEKRLGLYVLRIEVGHVDFLRDSAILEIYYEPEGDEINTTDVISNSGDKGFGFGH